LVIDFSKVDLKEYPVLVLRNADGTAIQTLGYAFNTQLSIYYNEASTISFDIPAYVDGVKTPQYDSIVGMRIVDLAGWGQFVLSNPSIEMDGVKEIKKCKAYSLEYELTYKKISLNEDVYNFWNPVMPNMTIMGIIMSYLPSWSIGQIDSDLTGKYRTFSIDNANLYNFIKSDVQQTFGCIFDFDTYNRKVNVKSVSSFTATSPVYISLDNLASDIKIEEDTENIFTCLDVNGADGVDIRSVNPLGTNKVYNLDYFMNTGHFEPDMVTKWNAWKLSFASKQAEYYNTSVERALKTSAVLTEEAALTVLVGRELASLENLQAVYIENLATLSTSSSDYAEFQLKLSDTNMKIAAKKVEITNQRNLILQLENEKDLLTNALITIQISASFANFFTADELIILDRYIKEDSIEDSSFVISTVDSYAGTGESNTLLNSEFSFSGGVITEILGVAGKRLFSIKGGTLIRLEDSTLLNANVISASIEVVNADETFVLSAYLSNGTLDGITFPSGCISLTGRCAGLIFEDATPDPDAPGAYLTGTTIHMEIATAKMYFTKNTTAYEQYSVEWDLYEYGRDCLEKLSSPSYSFSVSSANFLALDDFISFANNLTLGQKIYLDLSGGKVLEPILIGVEVDFENLSSLKLHFGDKYSASDSALQLVDLLDKSISMGKTVDTKKISYNAFLDSGASTAVKQFMESALDVSKNAILSSSDISVSWDANGIRCRKLDTDGSFEPEQIAIINNSIVFTDDSWQSAKMAIGKFRDNNLGDVWGFVAPNIVGTLLAGQNLVIESEKQHGGISVFKVDSDGASLHNARFDIENGISHIVLDPNLGFAIGSYPVVTGGANPVWDQNNAKFWVDTSGNLHYKGALEGANGTFAGSLQAASGTFAGALQAATGTFGGSLQAATGTFSGELSAATGRFKGIVQASDYQDLSGRSMVTSQYKFAPDYLELKGINVNNNFVVDSAGNVTLRGNITMTGGNITWNSVNSDPTIATAQNRADNAYNRAESAYSRSSTAATMATQIANGIFHEGTFINGRDIFAPRIMANEFSVMPISESGGVGGYNIYGYYNSNLYHFFRLGYYDSIPPYITFESPGGAYATWGFRFTDFTNRVNFKGIVDFSQATVIGL
jgi:hypothetical protein